MSKPSGKDKVVMTERMKWPKEYFELRADHIGSSLTSQFKGSKTQIKSKNKTEIRKNGKTS